MRKIDERKINCTVHWDSARSEFCRQPTNEDSAFKHRQKKEIRIQAIKHWS